MTTRSPAALRRLALLLEDDQPVDENGLGTIKLRAWVIPGSGGTPPELVEILAVGGKILGQKFEEVF